MSHPRECPGRDLNPGRTGVRGERVATLPPKERKLNLLFSTNDLYKNCPEGREELTRIKTYYETLFTGRGEDIKYCCFQLD